MLSRGKIIKKSCETPYIFGPKVASKREKRGKRSNLQVILDSNYGPRNLLLYLTIFGGFLIKQLL